MLIVSKFKDYYDSVAFSKGVDKTIVYGRKNDSVAERQFYQYYGKKEIYFPSYENRPWNRLQGRKRRGDGPIKSFDAHIIGFCGRLYPMLAIEHWGPNGETVVSHSYDIDDIEVLHKKHCSTFYPFYLYKNLLTDRRVLDLFVKHKTPIFRLAGAEVNLWGRPQKEGRNLELNPELKQFGFFRIVDAYTAFQEVEMYISGVLGVDSQKPVEVSDRSKIEGHGFDYRTSFRKDKEE